MRILPAGATPTVLVLRALLVVLPCAALAMALPQVPHVAVVVPAIACALLWAGQPDHPAGAICLFLVVAWWTAHGVVDWRLLVVGVLLVSAHVVAVLLAHGPGTLPVDRGLALLWLRRGALALVPMPVAYVAVRGLDPGLAPPWLWTAAAVATVLLLLVTSRMTQPEHE